MVIQLQVATSGSNYIHAVRAPLLEKFSLKQELLGQEAKKSVMGSNRNW